MYQYAAYPNEGPSTSLQNAQVDFSWSLFGLLSSQMMKHKIDEKLVDGFVLNLVIQN